METSGTGGAILSVIIPVFNVEKTLDRCISSVASQDFRPLQIILVDDGSPDRCPAICDRWAERDKRILVVHKKNGGLSDARNAGIRKATAPYITFVDSDDEILPNTYSSVMQAMKSDYDFLEFPVYKERTDGKKHLFLHWGENVYENICSYWYEGRAYEHLYACNKIFRRQLFDTVRFPVGKLFEDAYTLPLILGKCHKVATTKKGAYRYTANPQGITMNAKGLGLLQLLEAYLQAGFNIRESVYYLHLLNIQIDVYDLTGRLLLPPSKVDFSQLTTTKERIKGLLVNILGTERVCKLFKTARRMAHGHL